MQTVSDEISGGSVLEAILAIKEDRDIACGESRSRSLTSTSSVTSNASTISSGVQDDPEEMIDHGDSITRNTVGAIPTPTLMQDMYRKGDYKEFKLRGGSYLIDYKKVSQTQEPMFPLICMDLYETKTQEECFHICSRVENRVNQAQSRGGNEWTFVVNFCLPGPPYYSLIAYFRGDKAMIEDNTPFGKVARPFFFGDSDNFRDSRFKVIPRILDANLIIQMLNLQDKPTLLGNKLKQHYFRGENYFEIDVEVGSNSISRSIVSTMMGVSTSMVVDIGMCLQGNEEEELPEVLMCDVIASRVDVTTATKL